MAPLRRLALAACVAFAVASTRTHAATCALTGGPEVDYNTLVASPTDPTSQAIVVSGDCKPLATIALVSRGILDVDNKQIARVLSVPTGAISISTAGGDLSRGADFSMATNAEALTVSGIPADPRLLRFPPTLQTITFKGLSEAPPLDGVVFPPTLTKMEIYSSGLTSLKNVQLPASLRSLLIGDAPATVVDFSLPATLKELTLIRWQDGNVHRLVLPSSLEVFKLHTNGPITSFRGIRWPATLQQIHVAQVPNSIINVFEIRRSDVPIFENIVSLDAVVTQTGCETPAVLERIYLRNFCVLSDTDFDRLYGGGSGGTSGGGVSGGAGGTTSPKPSGSKKPKSSTNTNGVTETTSDSPQSDGDSSEGSTSQGPSENGMNSASSGSSAGSRSRPQGNDSDSAFSSAADGAADASTEGGDTSPNASRRAGRAGDRPEDAAAGSKSSSRSSMGTIVIVLISAVSLVVCLGLCRVFIKRKKRHQDVNVDDATTVGKYTRGTSPTTTPSNPVTGGPVVSSLEDEGFGNNFRYDKELLRCRIEEVQTGKRIARGGYGIVYRGSYQGRVVAVKQMLPDAWKNDSMTAAFVDEIRMCARLHHPKIVEFIGVSWSSARNLSAVCEFMPGGDLNAVLRKNPESSGREWTRPWTPNHLRSKTLIATDVVEALVYLHSFETPIIHRDLKTKNVLLDLVGNAKLSDFGISREMTVDETMTSEVGTAAWIAPEVLRGERYSEKADIYSLGVLLVEMDRCSHPYANDPALLGLTSSHGGSVGRANTSHVAQKNTQIAILVSTGKLKPTPTTECPLNVAALIARCLSFDASERLTAVEVLQGLQRICESQTEASTCTS